MNARISKRLRVEKFVHLVSFHICYVAFHILLKYSIWSISAQCIQRAVRTTIGRMELRFRLILFSRAAIIQSSFRTHAQRKNLLLFFRLLIKMATKAQCAVRQLRSRRVTLKRYLVFKELNKQLAAEKKRVLVEKSKTIVAINTQRLCRKKRIQKAIEKIREKELEASREMDYIKYTYIKARAIQQRELEQHYENKRILWQRHCDEDKCNEKLKLNVERVNRKIVNVTEAEREKNDIIKMQDKLQKEIRAKVQQLQQEVVAKCQSYRIFCLRCLECPTDQDEIKTGKQLDRLIRKR